MKASALAALLRSFRARTTITNLERLRVSTANKVSNGCVLEDRRGRIAHVQKHPIECAMVWILRNKISQLIRIPKRGERSVHHTNDLAESDLGWSTPQPPTARTPAHALHYPGMLQFEQDQT